MALEHLVVPEAIVKVSESQGFAVSGLSQSAVTALFYRHRGELSGLFDQVIQQIKDRDAATPDDIQALLLVAMDKAPVIIAEIITLARGGRPSDPTYETHVDTMTRFPLGVQMDAMQKIAEMTFTSEMPPGKFLALAVRGMTGASAALSKQSPSLI